MSATSFSIILVPHGVPYMRDVACSLIIELLDALLSHHESSSIRADRKLGLYDHLTCSTQWSILNCKDSACYHRPIPIHFAFQIREATLIRLRSCKIYILSQPSWFIAVFTVWFLHRRSLKAWLMSGSHQGRTKRKGTEG